MEVDGCESVILRRLCEIVFGEKAVDVLIKVRPGQGEIVGSRIER